MKFINSIAKNKMRIPLLSSRLGNMGYLISKRSHELISAGYEQRLKVIEENPSLQELDQNPNLFQHLMKAVSTIFIWLPVTLVGEWPKRVKNAVLIAIPHTSNWICLCQSAFFSNDIPVKFTIKKRGYGGTFGHGCFPALERLPSSEANPWAEKTKTYTEAMIGMLKELNLVIIVGLQRDKKCC